VSRLAHKLIVKHSQTTDSTWSASDNREYHSTYTIAHVEHLKKNKPPEQARC